MSKPRFGMAARAAILAAREMRDEPEPRAALLRCTNCGEWGKGSSGECKACGLPWTPRAFRGLPSVR